MFNQLIVALDYSEFARPVLDEAISLAGAMGAQLMLLHVLSPEDSPGYQLSLYAEGYYPPLNDSDLYYQEWSAFKNRSLQHLEADTDTAKAAGVSAEFTQLYGSPGSSICEFARHWNADLILMGRHGRTGIREFLLGSVSNYVLHHGHCAVLVLNPPAQSPTVSVQAEALQTKVV
jgi:nucleotide-binding universal stress UspA family protein